MPKYKLEYEIRSYGSMIVEGVDEDDAEEKIQSQDPDNLEIDVEKTDVTVDSIEEVDESTAVSR